MPAETLTIYRFGGFELDASERILMSGQKPVSLAPRVFDTLHMLVANAGHVLSKERMLAEVWEGSFVEENNLAQNISLLRKMLAKGGDGKFIETVPKFGYRFVAPVEIAEPETIITEKISARVIFHDFDEEASSDVTAQGSLRPALTSFKPETRYVQNGDVNIAYQVVGDGDLDVVFVMGWVSHLEYFWEEPHFAAFLNRLASFSRLILFDKRGTGLSDRVPLSELPTLEQRMEDVHAVMDAVGSERAALIGVSEGGPMCSLFAATYPERTAALVMIGTYAKRIRDEDYPWGVSAEDREEFFEMMRRDWGKPVGIEERAPSLAEDEDFREWWATYLRMGASPGAAAALTKMNAEIDVRDVLPSVRVPTLVIHRSGDLCLKVEEGRYVASLIPGSKYLELDGIDHLPFVGNQNEVLDPIEEFLLGIRHAEDHDRVLATVLSVKMIGSRDKTTLSRAHDHIRRQLDLFKGREVSFSNGVANTWKGPGMAIAIVKDDKVVFAKGYGSRELGKSDPINENTVFAIASNSKAFTTASLAILVDEKKLAWDDKVSKYLPDFKLYDPWVTSELTIRDLVTHRVGLDTFSGDLLWYETNFTPDEILARVRHLKPVSSFRTRYGYQNLMFIAAGKVVEKASGKPWCDFVTERILSPLGMNRTTCSIKNLPDNAAFPHNESGGSLRVLARGNVDGGYSAAALNSSVTDLSKWVRTQLGKGKFEGKTIFSEAQAWQMHQPFLAQQISEPAWKGNPTRHFSGVASGWFVYDYHGRKIINHSGGLDGMLSYTVLIPEENIGFLVLTNSEFPPYAVMMSKIRDVFVNAPKRDWNSEAIEQVKRNKAAADEEIKKSDAARVANTRPALAISNYAGAYSDELYGAITVAEESGRLVMRFSRSPNFVADLEHWHYDTFQIKWRPSVSYNFPSGFVTFMIDKDGKTDELKIDQPNNDFWFYELHPKRVK